MRENKERRNHMEKEQPGWRAKNWALQDQPHRRQIEWLAESLWKFLGIKDNEDPVASPVATAINCLETQRQNIIHLEQQRQQLTAQLRAREQRAVSGGWLKRNLMARTPVIGAGTGVALTLMGFWLSGWDFNARGAQAVECLVLCLVTAALGLAMGILWSLE